MTSQSTLCRYFMNGACRQGDRCQFSHNFADRPSNVCRYYQRGECSYGSSCRYDHVRNDTATSSTANRRRPSPAGRSAPNQNQQQQPRSIWRSNRSSTAVTSAPVNDTLTPNSSSSSSFSSAIVVTNSVKNGCNRDAAASKLRVDAAEFIPRSSQCASARGTYSQAVHGGQYKSSSQTEANELSSESIVSGVTIGSRDIVCPYNMMGHCWYGDQCSFLHGDVCDLCSLPALHPTDKEHNAKHRTECLAIHEREMESAFADALSREKQCGICMEVVLDKTDKMKQRFGVLPGCKHCFCLDCIRKWRQAKTFENKIIRACPECRTVSDFVVPSSTWVEAELEKKELIDKYRDALRQKPCKYFARGQTSSRNPDDECPFGNKCFYKHQMPDGRVVTGDSPRAIRARRRQRSSGGLYAVWSFLRQREASGESSNGDGGAWNDLDVRLNAALRFGAAGSDDEFFDTDDWEDDDWDDINLWLEHDDD